MGCFNSKAVETTRLSTGFKSSDQSFTKIYTLAEELGTGAFSVVRAATRISDGKKVAVKIIKKKKLSKGDEEALRHEIDILQVNSNSLLVLHICPSIQETCI